jgi:hypothetical protein
MKISGVRIYAGNSDAALRHVRYLVEHGFATVSQVNGWEVVVTRYCPPDRVYVVGPEGATGGAT